MAKYAGALVAEVHQIIAAQQLTGALPDKDFDDDHGVRGFLAGSAGGLFELRPHTSLEDFDLNSRRRTIKQVSLKLGGQSAWSIAITDGTTDTVVLSGTTEVNIVLTDEIKLSHDEKLKITTTGATSALRAVVHYDVGADLK